MNAAWVAVAAVVAISFVAAAHKPAAIGESYPTRADAIQLRDIDVSQVIYTEITETEPQSWFFVETETAFDLYISLGVPTIERFAGFRPTVAIIGPGLPSADLPASVEVPSGSGAILLETADILEPESFYEPFTGTQSWILFQQTVSLPQAARYDVVLFSSAEEENAEPMWGKLWVAIGVRESFGIRDVLGLPGIVRDVRAFHEVPPRMSAVDWIRLAVAAAVVGWVVWTVARRI